MDELHTNAEAGPSNPRSLGPIAPTRPIPDPPPATPPSTAKSQKRRSWFGLTLGSPNILSSPTPNASSANDTQTSPTKKGSIRRERRKSGHSLVDKEELELSSIGTNKGKERRLIDNQHSGPEPEEKGGIQDGDTLTEELLTIEGDLEETIKKKKKKRRSKSDQEDGQVMRMSDLGSGSLKGLGIAQNAPRGSLNYTPTGVIDLSEPINTQPKQSQPFTIRTRTFSRTASDRDTFSPPDPPSSLRLTPKSSTASLTDIRPRTSSLCASHSPSPRVASLHIDKSQPPLPVDVDRALPPLPSKDSGFSTTLMRPEIPKGIVVTPSSPRKLSKTPKKPPLIQRRSRSATGYSRQFSENSETEEKRSQSNNQISAPRSYIGLGLPSALLPSPKSSTEMPPPPPVPSKTQSVSSPFPSRTPSPIPKIAFVEPNGTPLLEKADEAPAVEEKRKVVRRTRSLSGFFGKSPPGIRHDKMPEAEPKKAEAGESVGKTGGGVLEWLGVRKPVKRITSEAQLKGILNDEKPAYAASDITSVGQQVSSGSEERLLLDGTPNTTLSDSQQPTPRRPQFSLSPSTATSIPRTEINTTGSMFTRRASDRGTDDQLPTPPVPVVPMSIPNAGMRNQTALSSESSFTLPTHDPVSPFIPGSGPWVSTPQSENEEIIFSTPEAETSNWGPGRRPWMDAGEYRNSSKSSLSTPLDSLPEQGVPTTHSPLKAPPTVREGRVRSWSDAPLPPQKLLQNQLQSSNPHLPLPRPTTPNGTSLSTSAFASPRTPSRPKLGDRSNSGNSAIIGRMKSVFSKSTNRGRSGSLLRKGSSEIDEFGNIPISHGGIGEFGRSQKMRPSTSSSSMASSNAGALRGRSIGEENFRPSHDLSEERSPRSSVTPSLSSLMNTRSDIGDKTEILHEQESKAARKNRVRASTISLAPTSHHFGPPRRPSSPNLFPIAATPPRRRPGTIHRLSNGLFGSGGASPGPSSPKNSLFPLPPRSSGSMSSSYNTNQGFTGWEDSITNTTTETTNSFLSPGTSPRPSTGSLSAAVSPGSSDIKQVVQRDGEEPPKVWLDRIVNNVGRNEIANVLASSGDEFHLEALQIYMSTFDFTHNSLDIALRRLLMHMSLPRETQQIDRVIEAFSKRYEECEPHLFGSKDNTYVLAFSMMMLHTDAFNKSNKNKMTKVDYVRNTRMEGVLPVVLESFYDNITYTPFVFIDDDSELKRSSGYESTSSTFGPSTPVPTPTITSSSLPSTNTITSSSLTVSSGIANGKAKIDVYHMIARGLLGTLRVAPNLIDNERIQKDILFSYQGTKSVLDLDNLCKAFASAHNLVIPSFITSSTYSQRKVSGKLATPRRNTVGAKDLDRAEDLILRVVKVGLLSRKDNTDHSSKKTSRKWKSWSVILTSSQLLFFKDPTWALTLLEQIRTLHSSDQAGQLLLPRQSTFKPDEVFSLKDCVAVFDHTFTAYSNTFRFVMPQSRQYLLQSSDELEMNEWISLINYAATFKTVNLKMKGPTMRKDQVVLAGAAAAASHKRELRDAHTANIPPGSAKKAIFGDSTNAPRNPVLNDNSTSISTFAEHTLPDESVTTNGRNEELDVNEANEIVHEGEQLEEVFGVVKAELAAGRGEAGSTKAALPNGSADLNLPETAVVKDKAHIHTSRVSLIYSLLNDLRSKSQPVEDALQKTSDLIRNISLLTPFLKSTRDKLTAHLQEYLHKMRNDKLVLTKLKLYIKVLEYEGEREDREWKVVRHVALQAAARSLREDSLDGVIKDVNRTEDGQIIPKLTLPSSNNDENITTRRHLNGSTSDTENNDGQGRSDRSMNSPVELPELIRKSSEEPSSKFDKRRPSTSDQTSSIHNKSGMRKSNSASDLLDPKFNQGRNRRSSEIDETALSSPRTDTENNNDDDDNDNDRGKPKDTPLLIFKMESPLENTAQIDD
ncbi:uncharacterized protein I206_106539 [Kwoniella pini CBS 10737]|uniref:SEC7 domain-containing protein n=1 Tax=Kwoniella pini CBS 10737 TaxID=1296096 RepID=A0A1B9HS90_9TREE|nr:uncharacterized protein I206_07927 [Kwoniella pini CBS 10737]OCF46142.1 hypothetical protein I206_07927 [Kwoniella pini CBS 10737]